MDLQITRTTPVYRSPAKTGVFVQWVVNNPSTTDPVATFALHRSGAPEGPFELVVDHLTGFHFFDDLRNAPLPDEGDTRENLNFLSLSRAVYYRVTATTTAGVTFDVVRAIGATIQRRKIELLRRKMQRDLGLSFKFNGIDLGILKRKHWGTRCGTCFDGLTKSVTKSKCDTCFGTGFEGGYFEPVRIQGRIGVQNVQTTMTQHDVSDVNQKRLTVLDYPEIEKGDVIVDVAQNKRYTVLHRHSTEMQTRVVHQQLTISELARDSVEYRLQVNKDHMPVIY